MSTSDYFSSICSFPNSVSGCKNSMAFPINIPLSQSPKNTCFQLSGKSSFAGDRFKLLFGWGNLSRRVPSSKFYARKADEFDIYRELGLKGKKEKVSEIRQFGNSQRIPKQENSEDHSGNDKDSSSLDFLEGLGISEKGSIGKPKYENLMRIEEGLEAGNEVPVVGRRSERQMMKRSNIIAKQVISIQSALSLGFVSQLWVDTSSWLVLVVEVRPSLLSGELERCLLEDIRKVGDVLLVEDEHVMENDFKLVGLETLVGYTVVTPGRRNIGKVRGYTFNINSGAVESLELDSFGISIIPSSLVSTFALFVEDVLEVLPDTIIVHEAAASRIQRLTKGVWGTENMGDPLSETEEYSGQRGSNDAQSRYRRSKGRKFRHKTIESSDEWELPMDYL